jgi:inner membrane protein
MVFWHLGATLWLFRWIFRDPKVDVRFLLVGAILPDLVDLPLGTLFLGDRYSTGELWLHSLLLPTLYMSIVLLTTRRGRRRRAWMALGIGWLLHLLLDGMWTAQEVFLWPFFGLEIPSGPEPFWPLAWERALSDPWRWAKELVGIGYLMWLWISLGMSDRGRRRETLETGRLPDHVPSN